MLIESQELKMKILDQSNQEIMLAIAHAAKEITELKQLLKGIIYMYI